VWGLWQRWFAAGHFADDKGGRDLQHKVEAKAFAHFAQRVKEVEGQDGMIDAAVEATTRPAAVKKHGGKSSSATGRSKGLLARLSEVFWKTPEAFYHAVCVFLIALDKVSHAAAELCIPVHIRVRWQREFAEKFTDHLSSKAMEIKLDVGLSSRKFDRLRHHIISDRDPLTRQHYPHEVQCCASGKQ